MTQQPKLDPEILCDGCQEPQTRCACVRGQPHAHYCHWPRCKQIVPPKMWGCFEHWFKLPKNLRAKVWDAYVPGQEITKTPSKEYIAVVKEVRAWVLDNFFKKKKRKRNNVLKKNNRRRRKA